MTSKIESSVMDSRYSEFVIPIAQKHLNEATTTRTTPPTSRVNKNNSNGELAGSRQQMRAITDQIRQNQQQRRFRSMATSACVEGCDDVCMRIHGRSINEAAELSTMH
jgi:hypothetical protein